MKTTVTLIPGDGIGPEVVSAVRTVFQAAEAPIDWEVQPAGAATLEQQGELIPQSVLDSIQKNKLALKGPIATPVGKGFRSVNVTLRQTFDLYANQRPVRNLPGVASRYTDVDTVLFRENTEGLYSGLEVWDEQRQIADSINRLSREGCERIIRAAFEFAKQNGRKKVTLMHKANILKVSNGLFLDIGRQVAADYPAIEFTDLIIDNGMMQLVMRPERFDVLVATNMFGDLLSDLLAGLVGGLGVVPGANIGTDIAIFEAVHGTAPDIAGQNKANPTSLLLSALMMLRHMGHQKMANQIEQAIFTALQDPASRTPDLGGSSTTQGFTQRIVQELEQLKAHSSLV